MNDTKYAISPLTEGGDKRQCRRLYKATGAREVLCLTAWHNTEAGYWKPQQLNWLDPSFMHEDQREVLEEQYEPLKRDFFDRLTQALLDGEMITDPVALGPKPATD